MHSIDFVQTNLSNAQFIDNHLERINFYEADLSGAKFKDGYLIKCSFEGSTLDDAIFQSLEIEHDGGNVAVVASADGAIFLDCELSQIRKETAEAIFKGATISNCKFN